MHRLPEMVREVEVRLIWTVCLGLFISSIGAAAQTAAERKACQSDYEKYCRHVVPGGGRIAACLYKERDKLSKSCRKAFTDHEK